MGVVSLVVTFILGYGIWRLTRSWSSPNDDRPLAAVAGPRKEHWLTGNMHRLYKDSLEFHLDLYRTYGGVVKVYGVLGAELLLVHDPLALQSILVKDQDSYEETGMFIEANKLLFGEGLIATLGDQHKKQRKLLNPVFSLANLRAILPQIQTIADELVEQLQRGLNEHKATELDVLPWLRKGTIEYVGRGILGVNLDSLEPGKSNAYTKAIFSVQHTALKVFFLRPLVPWAVRNVPAFWRGMMVEYLPFPALRELREMARTMHRAAEEIFRAKKAEVEGAGDGEGADIGGNLMNIMIKANLSTEDSKARLTAEELIGDINAFLLGGQETTTSALARLLWIFPREPHTQARLRSEVRAAKHRIAGGTEGEWQRASLPYDVLTGLPYLDAVVRETLRLHPPTSIMHRVATKDAILPLQDPIRTPAGEEVKSVRVPAGTTLAISILGANRNTRVWGADAGEWRPERWIAASGGAQGRTVDMEFGDEYASGQGKEGVRYPGVYGGMMTFFGGNRACIGFKFAEMEMKQILSTLVSTMRFSLPSAVDPDSGARKEIYWRIDGLQVPVVPAPHGDGKTSQVPLDVRLVREEDFL
ncbi:cytochrome P450 [Trametes polyzona]|nr:cytochrome P450 [Trametes polyzona]